MACQQELMALGKAYPRTCQDCGLGPCKNSVPQPAQPEQEPVFDCPRCGHCCPPQGIYCTPPQQEPVAWMDPSWANPDTRGWASESFKSAPIDGWTPLYTALPQRKPLTDEELDVMSNDFEEGYVFLYRSFARAIEAAHGIKEEA